MLLLHELMRFVPAQLTWAVLAASLKHLGARMAIQLECECTS